MDEIIDNSQDNMRGCRIAYIFIVAAFLLPYLIGWAFTDNYQVFMVYVPIGFIGFQNGLFYGGPSPMAFLMIPYWIPYPILGFLTLKYARGDYSSTSVFLIRAISVLIIAVVLFITLLFAVSTSSLDYLPVPVAIVLFVLILPIVKPTQLKTTWNDT